MTVLGTLCYVMREGKALLIRKERGFGVGKLNAPGGKLKEGETPEEGVVREVLEETGLQLKNVSSHGVLRFYFGQRKDPDWIVYIFSSRWFDGEVKDSDEGVLQWVDLKRPPYDEMWEDDRHWLPLLLENRSFSGDFYFDESGEKLIDYQLKNPQSVE